MTESVSNQRAERVYNPNRRRGTDLTAKQTIALELAATAIVVVGIAGAVTWFLDSLKDGADNLALASWSDHMREKLDSRSFLEGEQYSPRVRVTDGNQGVTEVNIRPFPGTILPTGKIVDVLGTIRVGEEILDAVLVDGKQPGSPQSGKWVAFRCGDAAKARWDPKSKQRVEAGGVCAIYSRYAVLEGNPKK